MTLIAPRPVVSRPSPVPVPRRGSRLLSLLRTTDHKTIGLMYLFTSFLYFFAGGFMATMTQTLMTLVFGTAAESLVPNLGASGAIAAVLGAYFVLYPNSKVFGLFVIFPLRVSAWFFLGFWFLYQLIEANFGLFSATANGGGVAFFAHVGGFLFGVIVTVALVNVGRLRPQDYDAVVGAPA